jgi:hypothetical protein
MRRVRRPWWVLLLAIAVILPLAWLQLRPREPSDRVKDLLGSEAMAILSDADRVQVFRVDGHSREGEALLKPGPRLRGYLVIGRGEDQGQEFAADLAAVLFRTKPILMKSPNVSGLVLPIASGRGNRRSMFSFAFIATISR